MILAILSFAAITSTSAQAMCSSLENGITGLIKAHPVAEKDASDIFMHALAKEFNINPSRLEMAESTFGYEFRGYANSGYLFVRDYFPIQIKTVRGGQLRTQFIKYPSLIHGGQAFSFNAPTPHGKPPGVNHEYLRFEAGRKRIDFWAETTTLPLLMEGGNILKTNSRLLVGEKIMEINQLSESQLIQRLAEGSQQKIDQAKNIVENAKSNGWRQRSRNEIIAKLAHSFSVPAANISVLEAMPYEATRHVDMFVGVLNHKTAALPYIPERFLSKTNLAKNESTLLNQWLDKTARELSSQGMNIIRLPMSPIESTYKRGGETLASIKSPVNWVIRGDKVLVPEYPAAAMKVSASTQREIKEEITTTMEKLGFRVEFINADRLITSNGSLHRITANYDLSEFYHLRKEVGL